VSISGEITSEARLAPFGTHPTIGENRSDGDVLRFVFQHADHATQRS
jgi:hypothetical protein